MFCSYTIIRKIDQREVTLHFLFRSLYIMTLWLKKSNEVTKKGRKFSTFHFLIQSSAPDMYTSEKKSAIISSVLS